MKTGKKIGWFVILVCGWGSTLAQTDRTMLPIANKLLLNPSFSGLDKKTSVCSGTYFLSESKRKLNNEFFLTYDTYVDKLKGGIAFYFYQGLHGEVNTNTTGAGFTYSKPLSFGTTKKIIPSININYRLASRQWFAYTIDELTGKQLQTSSPPAEAFRRYNLLRPVFGLLWDSPLIQTGLSVSWPLQQSLATDEDHLKRNAPEFIFYFAKNTRNKHKGLTSKPFKATPEVIVLVANNVLLTHTGFKIEQTKHIYALFFQNNFHKSLHGMGGTFGRKFQNFVFSLSAGTSFSVNSEKLSFSGEMTIALIIPYIHSDKKNPWSLPKKKFLF